MIKNFQNIPVELPELAILKRMGYNRHLTGISGEQVDKINHYIGEAYGMCKPVGRYDRFDIVNRDGSRVVLEGEYEINSVSVAKLLLGSNECVMLAARADQSVIEMIEKYVAQKNGVAALIYDAVASEVVDACLSWMIQRIGMDISRFGLRTTSMRYSAGYGDFPLENQKLFYDVLKMEEMGVTLSENYIFSPEKTVTALCGIE